jgi:hypothetical protein
MNILLAAMGLMTRGAILRGVLRFILARASIVDVVAIVTPEPGCWRYLVVYEQSEFLYVASQTGTILRTVLGRLSWP